MTLTMEEIERRMEGPRPGRPAQERMAPRPRPGDIPPPPPMHPTKEAGVLVLLYLTNQKLHFVLTVRTDTVAMHKGQVSLPGGARENGESLEETALRETGEELGIDPSRIRLTSRPLTPLYIPVSGFWVTPFVGFWQGEPQFRAAPAEVIEVLRPPVMVLLDEQARREEDWEIRGQRVRVPFFSVEGHRVWGATAMMLGEFAEMLKSQD